MTYKVSNTLLRDALWQRTVTLMKKALLAIDCNEQDVEKKFYNRQIHQYLQIDHSMPHISHPREIYLPLPTAEWPIRLQKLVEGYTSVMKWPYYSSSSYATDKLLPPNIPEFLYSGYAVCKEELIPCSFFIVMQMTEQPLADSTEALPEFFVVDPLAKYHNIEPDCYIGIHIGDKHLAEWLLSDCSCGLPIETQVEELLQKHF